MYIFKTLQFGLTDDELHLMRSGYPYKKLYLMDVSKIEIKSGTATKHPITLMIFGILMLVVAGAMIWSGWFAVSPSLGETANWSQGVKLYGGLLTWFFFMLAMAILSFYNVFAKQLIMVVEFLNGTSEVLKLKPIKKQNKLIHLIEFLMSKFGTSRFRFNDSVVR